MIQTHVLYCDCAYSDIIPESIKDRVRDFLSTLPEDISVAGVIDLCELAARKDAGLQTLAQAENAVVIACYDRTVRWLLHRAGVKDTNHIRFVTMRGRTAEEVLAELSEVLESGAVKTTAALPIEGEKGEWIPWFPVIDYDKCTGCRQCLNFCLFGTYTVNEAKRVEVTNPSHCKTGCPACARVCPQGAIIFPKYTEAPINGGPVEETEAEATAIDLEKLSEVDLYELLKKRNQGSGRFTAEKDMQAAIDERIKCYLKSIQQSQEEVTDDQETSTKEQPAVREQKKD